MTKNNLIVQQYKQKFLQELKSLIIQWLENHPLNIYD